tara:strand:- start:478 stop:897 length:420 start_codon:yes stop_codon:yes gene_type:complete
MITKVPVDLDNIYITKPLHADTLVAALKEKSHHTLHRLYLVTNGVKDRQCFLELIDHDTYTISAHINIKHAYASEAKEQASVLRIMKPLLSIRPQYTISFSINRKVDMLEVFNFKHSTSNKSEVYNLIAKLQTKIEELI